MNELQNLSDQALLEKTRHLVKEEREITTRVLHHLREVEKRRLFSDLGYPSLFAYAMGDLHYSESSAHRRIAAMRLLKELPELEERIESGELSLSVVSQAQAFFRQEAKAEHALAPEQKRELLSALVGKSSREAERELLTRASEPERLRPEVVRPVNESLSEVRCLVDQETLQKLERIRGLLGHTHSEMSMSELIAKMAEITLDKLDPAKEPKRAKPLQAQPRPQPEPQQIVPPKTQVSQLVSAQKPTVASVYFRIATRREYIHASMRREVWRRASGKCVLCGSVHRLQIDHIRPVAKGGTNEKENLRLLCFNCNQRQAVLKLGIKKMEFYQATS
jgi:hypothetical protein